MFESIKEWMNVKFQYRPFVRHNGAGTAQYGEAVNASCYPVGDIKVVANDDGVEVTSTTQLYVDGSTPINVLDQVLFSNAARKIIRINDFYRNGVVDIRVVYL